MKTAPSAQDIAITKAQLSGPLSREMAHELTRQLAILAGHSIVAISQTDYEQAKRKLTDQADAAVQEAMFDALPESKRWDPAPDSSGYQTLEPRSDEDDSEGWNISAQLVEEGMEDAAREQQHQAKYGVGKHSS